MRRIHQALILTTLLSAGSAPAALLGEYYSNFTRPNGIITVDPAALVMTRTDANIDFWTSTNPNYVWQPVASGNWYAVRWRGLLRIDTAGDYALGTVSDDGSQV